jgi:hypothetical protein
MPEVSQTCYNAIDKDGRLLSFARPFRALIPLKLTIRNL